jgi:hypothetical protein
MFIACVTPAPFTFLTSPSATSGVLQHLFRVVEGKMNERKEKKKVGIHMSIK